MKKQIFAFFLVFILVFNIFIPYVYSNNLITNEELNVVDGDIETEVSKQEESQESLEIEENKSDGSLENVVDSEIPLDGVNVPIDCLELNGSVIQGISNSWVEEQLSKYNVSSILEIPLNLRIPNEINGVIVREIASKTFSSDKYTIYSLNFDENEELYKIGNSAFYQQSLVGEVDLSKTGVRYLGDYAFGFCSNLESLKLPNNLEIIGSSVFYSCISLSNVDIPEGITTLGDSMFAYCKSLKSIKLPNSLTKLSSQLFFKTGLEEVIIPENIDIVTTKSFRDCVNLKFVYCLGDIREIQSSAFSGDISLIDIIFKDDLQVDNIIKFPETLTTIGYQAFKGSFNENTIIQLPYSLVDIGSEAFYTKLRFIDATVYDESYSDYFTSNSDGLVGDGISSTAFKLDIEGNGGKKYPVIFNSESVYTVFLEHSSGWMSRDALSYPMTVSFKTKESYENWVDVIEEKLYNFPFYFEKLEDSYWGENIDYSLPKYPEHENHVEGGKTDDSWLQNDKKINKNMYVKSSEVFFQRCEKSDEVIRLYYKVGSTKIDLSLDTVNNIDIRDFSTSWNSREYLGIEIESNDPYDAWDNPDGFKYSVKFTDSKGSQTDKLFRDFGEVKFGWGKKRGNIEGLIQDSSNYSDLNRVSPEYYSVEVKREKAGRIETILQGNFELNLFKEVNKLIFYWDYNLNELNEYTLDYIGDADELLSDFQYEFENISYESIKSNGIRVTNSASAVCSWENPDHFFTIGGERNSLIWMLEDKYITGDSLIAGAGVEFSGKIDVINPFVVIFEKDDGTEEYVYVPVGDELTEIPEIAEKPGYIGEWVEKETQEELGEIDSNKNVEIKWEPKIYNIVYKNLYDAENLNPIIFTIESENIELLPLNRRGYTFTGWTFDSQETPLLDVIIPMGSIGDKEYTANWNINNYNITYNSVENATFDKNNPISYTVEDATIVLNNPIRAGYIFKGWVYEGQTEPLLEVSIPSGSIGNKVFTAIWEKEHSGDSDDSGSNRVLLDISCSDGGSVSPKGRIYVNYNSDKKISCLPNDGYILEGIYINDKYIGNSLEYVIKNIKSKQKVYIKFEKEDIIDVSNILDTKHHNAYIAGYIDGSFGGDAYIKRCEVAQMIYRLLVNKGRKETIQFNDVLEDSWYYEAVQVLANQGYMLGVGGQTFEPNRNITRAEFSVILSRFSNVECEYIENQFIDVPINSWYSRAVNKIYKYGWIKGYPDGTFRPNLNITRAEAVVMLNRVLNREFDKAIMIEDGIREFMDISKGYWAYYDILEAANSHGFKRINGEEFWITH